MEHEHNWLFLGELVLTLTDAEIKIGGADFRRLEYCSSCGTVRAKFGDRWAYLYSDMSREYLKKFVSEKDIVVNRPPPHQRLTPQKESKIRLGKGLNDLMDGMRIFSIGTLKLLEGNYGTDEDSGEEDSSK